MYCPSNHKLGSWWTQVFRLHFKTGCVAPCNYRLTYTFPWIFIQSKVFSKVCGLRFVQIFWWILVDFEQIEANRHFVSWTRVGDNIRYYRYTPITAGPGLDKTSDITGTHQQQQQLDQGWKQHQILQVHNNNNNSWTKVGNNIRYYRNTTHNAAGLE